MTKRRRLATGLALVVVAALPVVAERLRSRSERCALDGSLVEPRFRARIVGADGAFHSFCGVRCADRWLARSGVAPREIVVTDCMHRHELPAAQAWFLHTTTGEDEGVPDFVRVFERRADAERHARAHGGEILTGRDRPLTRRRPHAHP